MYAWVMRPPRRPSELDVSPAGRSSPARLVRLMATRARLSAASQPAPRCQSGRRLARSVAGASALPAKSNRGGEGCKRPCQYRRDRAGNRSSSCTPPFQYGGSGAGGAVSCGGCGSVSISFGGGFPWGLGLFYPHIEAKRKPAYQPIGPLCVDDRRVSREELAGAPHSAVIIPRMLRR